MIARTRSQPVIRYEFTGRLQSGRVGERPFMVELAAWARLPDHTLISPRREGADRDQLRELTGSSCQAGVP